MSKKNDLFWEIVDQYDNGEIDKGEAYKLFLDLNNGDKDEANADLELLLKGEKTDPEEIFAGVMDLGDKCEQLKTYLYNAIVYLSENLGIQNDADAIKSMCEWQLGMDEESINEVLEFWED